MKKLKGIQLLLIISFVFFLFFLLKPKVYHKEYDISNVLISEAYNKSGYYFTFTYKDQTLDFFINHKYMQHRGFIKDIKIIQAEDDFCLIPISDDLSFIPICQENGKNTYYSLVSNKLKEEIPDEYFPSEKDEKVYEDIKIYNEDYTYFIWNYDGFYYLSNGVKKKIDLFKKEFYNVSLIGYTKDYLVISDYDSSYTYNKIYTISFKDGKEESYKLNKDIYFDSYFIGYENNKLYIVDNKESVMYELNAKNGKLDKVRSKVLINGKWEDRNIKSLVNQKESFSYKSNYEYTIEDNNLYLNYEGKSIKTLIANNIKNIVRIKNQEIFYLKEDTLYRFNPYLGEEKLLNYFEWNFNYENMIYIN